MIVCYSYVVAVALLSWGSGVVGGNVIRLATVLSTRIQPFDSYGDACKNITGCVGGFPIISAYLRDSAATHPQTTVWWLDTASKMVQFHPRGLAVNALAWERAAGVGLCGWTFDDAGMLTSAPESLNPLLEVMPVPPIASNVRLDQDSPYYNLFQRQVIVPPSPATANLTLGILVIQDWARTTYPTFNAAEQLPMALRQLRRLFHTDLNILMLGSAFLSDWQVLLRLDVDVLVTGRAYIPSYPTAPSPQYINGTGVAIRSKLQHSLSFVDIDLDLWRAKQSFLTFTEIDISQPVNFSVTPINDATYYSDLEWMQAQILLAAANDVTVGYCTDAVPVAADTVRKIYTCRHRECEIGTWWAGTLYAFMNADVAFINGGSFAAGWPAGNVNLTNIWASYPFTDSVCTFQVYGFELYDILVYAVSKGAPTVQYAPSTGAFPQLHNLRLTYNPKLNGTRITAIQVFDKITGTWGSLQRERIYTVVTTTYLCKGGDGFGFIKFVPGTSAFVTPYEVHMAALEVINGRGLDCPTLQGTLTITSSTTPLLIVRQTQVNCTINTYWAAGSLACLPCPAGTSNTAPGLAQCYSNPTDPSPFRLIIALVVGVGGGCLVMVGFVVCLVLGRRRREHARRLLDNAPTGLVTIVFTDIQGSTLLWDQQPAEMSAALEIHNRVIRSELMKFRGYEVKTIGDAFMVAFHSAEEAVGCCVGIQLALLQQPWPEGLLQTEPCQPVPTEEGSFLWRGLRVRMGLQVGEPEVVVNHSTNRVDYFGSMVNEAARVESRAHGGEICLTQDVMSMIGRARSYEEWVVKFIGEQFFKGVGKPIVVYSLHHYSLAERTYPPEKPLACHLCQEPLECPRCNGRIDSFSVEPTPRPTPRPTTRRLHVSATPTPKHKKLKRVSIVSAGALEALNHSIDHRPMTPEDAVAASTSTTCLAPVGTVPPHGLQDLCARTPTPF
eukprot:RCo016032